MEIPIPLTEYAPALRLKTEAGRRFVFDPVRQKWLVLQPEEMVRQLLLHYLVAEKGYNKNRLAIERGLRVNELQKRCDILVFDRHVQPLMLVECKAPQVEISEAAFRQIATYNLPLRVPYLLVTNGLTTFCCRMDYEEERFEFLPAVPEGAWLED